MGHSMTIVDDALFVIGGVSENSSWTATVCSTFVSFALFDFISSIAVLRLQHHNERVGDACGSQAKSCFQQLAFSRVRLGLAHYNLFRRYSVERRIQPLPFCCVFHAASGHTSLVVGSCMICFVAVILLVQRNASPVLSSRPS